MVHSLGWLRKQVAALEISLLLDLVGVHDASEVRREADSLGIHLLLSRKESPGNINS
jgi:hypothetical protein